MFNQDKNNNLNYITDPTFIKLNRLFVSSFENKDHIISFSKYYTPNVEIKDFAMKNKEKAYEKIIEMGRKNDYATGRLSDFEYFSKHYKLIAIDLSKKIEKSWFKATY